MQVHVSEVVLPGGWCSFCFYLVSHSSCCSCYLCWNCCSLFIVARVGLFFFLFFFITRITCCWTVISCTWGGAVFLCYNKFWRVVPVGSSLVCSGVICLCNGKLDVLYFAVKWWVILLLGYLDLLAEWWWVDSPPFMGDLLGPRMVRVSGMVETE